MRQRSAVSFYTVAPVAMNNLLQSLSPLLTRLSSPFGTFAGIPFVMLVVRARARYLFVALPNTSPSTQYGRFAVSRNDASALIMPTSNAGSL